jgi:hypothetical protein
VTFGPAVLTADRAAVRLVRHGRTARTGRVESGPARRTVPGTRTAVRAARSALG